MNNFLTHVAEMLLRASWQAGVLALIIFTVQWLAGSWLSARWRYRLWVLVVLRLLLPVVPAAQWSVHNWIAMPEAKEQTPPKRVDQVKPLERDLSVVVLEADSIPVQPAAPRTIPPPPARSWRDYVIPGAWIIWSAGFSLLFIRTLLATIKLKRQSRRFAAIDDPHILQILDDARQRLGIGRPIGVFESENLATPALMGLLRPRILLPTKVLTEFAPCELRLIFLHELAHLRRWDVAVNWLITLLNIIHWFNPLLWLAFARIRAERELACDELVLRSSSSDQRREYGNTMIKLLQAFSGGSVLPGAVGILEGQAPLRRRITMIAQFEPKRSRTWIALLTTILLAMICLTDSAVGQQRNHPPARGGYGGPGVGGEGAPGYGRPVPAPVVVQEGPNPRFANVETDKNAEAANEKTRATLRRPLPEVKFENVALRDALTFLQDVTELNVYVDWKNLEGASITQDAPVSLRLRNVPAGEVLRLMLAQIAPDLRYRIETGIVMISTVVPDPVAVIKAYNVDDLCYSDASFATRRKQLEDEMKKAADEAARNVITQQLRDFQLMIDQTKGGRMQELVGLIQSTVAPYTSSTMAVRSFDTKLIITADEAGHQEVAKVLMMLRDRGEGGGEEKAAPKAPGSIGH